MAIAKKPNRNLEDVGKPDPMAFIQGAEHSQTQLDPEPAKRKRKEPVLIRFDEHTLDRLTGQPPSADCPALPWCACWSLKTCLIEAAARWIGLMTTSAVRSS